MTAEAKHSEPAVERAEPCPVRVGPSTIPGAGRGVFATRDIKPGELVCIYEGTARPDKPTIAQLEYECNGVIGFADPVHRDGVGQLINDVSRLELLDKLDKKMSRDERCKTIMAAINSHLLSGNRCNVHLINKPDKLQLADGKEVVRMAVAAIKEIKKNSELFLSYNCMWWLNRYYFTTCDKDMLADVEYIWSMYGTCVCNVGSTRTIMICCRPNDPNDRQTRDGGGAQVSPRLSVPRLHVGRGA